MTVYIQKWTPFRFACALNSLQQGVNNVNGTTDPKNRQINRLALAALALAQADIPFALSAFATTGVAGQVSFTLSGHTLKVGQPVVIAGVYGGTGSISGYSNSTTYRVSATNGTTTATLTTLSGGALTTVAGTSSGITVTATPWAMQRAGVVSTTSTNGLLINVPMVPGFVSPAGTNDDGT
jgi:hypothetical protein